MDKAKPHTDGNQLLPPLTYPLHLFTPFVPAAINGYCFFTLGRAFCKLILVIKTKEKICTALQKYTAERHINYIHLEMICLMGT